MQKLNHLPIDELREQIRDKKIEVICWHCDIHDATDVHHINGDHSDNRPENLAPWCKRCHNEHHDISDNLTELTLLARTRDKIQKDRIATGNQIAAYAKLHYNVQVLQDIFEDLMILEKKIDRTIEKMVKQEPIYAAYLSKIKGVGPTIAAALISEIGDPGRFGRISALWSYCGLHVKDNGEAPKKRQGQKANWNQKLRMYLCGRLADSFVMQKPDATGRKLYDKYKAYYTERDTPKGLSKGHINNRARRKVVKVFLSCLWLAWRRMKGLPVTEPYAMTLPGHSHLVSPEDWAGKGWDDNWQKKLME